MGLRCTATLSQPCVCPGGGEGASAPPFGTCPHLLFPVPLPLAPGEGTASVPRSGCWSGVVLEGDRIGLRLSLGGEPGGLAHPAQAAQSRGSNAARPAPPWLGRRGDGGRPHHMQLSVPRHQAGSPGRGVLQPHSLRKALPCSGQLAAASAFGPKAGGRISGSQLGVTDESHAFPRSFWRNIKSLTPSPSEPLRKSQGATSLTPGCLVGVLLKFLPSRRLARLGEQDFQAS